MTSWDEWFDDLFGKAEQLELFAPRPKIQVHVPKERKIRERVDPPGGPTAAPKRKLVRPPKGGKAPPGGGWRRTPNGWARGQGNQYEWQPTNWADKAPAAKPGPVTDEQKLTEVRAAREAFTTLYRDRMLRGQATGGNQESAALENVYQVEKRHGFPPTTAKGVREALPGLPAEKDGDWRIAERGTKAARVVWLPNDDRLYLRWKNGRPQGIRQSREYTGGGHWRNIDQKWQPAAKAVEKAVEADRKWKERVERENKRRR
ncbi:MAG: hypothetical protein KJN79_00615 [Gammaproteobacteria bacterium]|nr:hypothetical protein [Gammaproteobacteria bacterium]